MGKSRSLIYVVAAFAPMVFAVVLVAVAEPFPSGWLDPSNPHYWPNLLRAFTFLCGGIALGMIGYTMTMAVRVESKVMAGHPRKLLYRHVTFISVAHAALLLTMLFYIRDRIDRQLSPATPLALVALMGTIYALALMIQYQGSRLQINSAPARKLLVEVKELAGDEMRVAAVESEGGLVDFHVGELVRLTVEHVATVGIEGQTFEEEPKL